MELKIHLSDPVRSIEAFIPVASYLHLKKNHQLCQYCMIHNYIIVNQWKATTHINGTIQSNFLFT